MYADVLVDIASVGVNRRYAYEVPQALQKSIDVGRRVLVPFGHRYCEGYVVELKQHTEFVSPRAILKVLDEETVLTSELLRLAEWMADYYLCPISLVLKTIIPRPLKRKHRRFLVPLTGEEEGQEMVSTFAYGRARVLMEKLWDEGEMSLGQARRIAGSNDVIVALEEAGLIAVCGSYRPASYTLPDQVYFLAKKLSSQELDNLSRRAPRQAQAIQMLARNGQVPALTLEKLVPKASLNSLIEKGIIVKKVVGHWEEEKPHVPTEYQQKAIKEIEALLESGRGEKCLLFGVTGSGKTEVYLQLADKAAALGKQVIVLVPEIALTEQMIGIFAARKGDRMAVIHSRLSDSERYEEFKRIRKGEVDLVLGARSAVFAPFTNLGLVIIDEEQEYTYKQESNPRYHAREVAQKRAELQGAVLLLGSASPCVETFYEVKHGGALLLELPERIGAASLPTTRVVDMRREFKAGNRSIFSGVLKKKLEACLNRDEQAILFLNRRGYFTFVICRECGLVLTCPHCSIPLTFHQASGKLHCHYCFHAQDDSKNCPRCGGVYLRRLGIGTQRVEEEVKRYFPAAAVRRMDVDTTRRKGSHREIITAMMNREIDILIGTQMVAKGFDFPQVSLVGVVAADTVLNLPDFRAYERGFQLLVQVAGRAGRKTVPGEVIIQTYQPDSYAIKYACNHDYLSFYHQEIESRRVVGYPPFSNLVRIVISSLDQIQALKTAAEIGQLARELLSSAQDSSTRVLGPGPCPLARLRDRYRFQLLLRGSKLDLLTSTGRYIIEKRKSKNVRIDIDVNPLSMM